MSKSTQETLPPQTAIDQIIGLYNEGQLEQTVSLAESLANQYPNAQILFDILGAAYMGLKNTDKTIKSYQNVLQLNPGHSDAYNNMGLVLYDQDRFEEAVESYQKAVEIEPDFADAHYNLANALSQLGDLKQAIESYKASLAINPSDIEVLVDYGNTLKNYGKFDQAIEVYAQALTIDPSSVSAQTNMDNAFEEKLEIEKLVCDYAKVTELDIGSGEIISFTGTILKARGYLDAAIDSYKKALIIKSDYAEAYYNMGVALQGKGELDAAIDNYKQALKIKPEYAQAYYNLGNALKDMGDLDAAMNRYREALKLKPDYTKCFIHDELIKVQLFEKNFPIRKEEKFNSLNLTTSLDKSRRYQVLKTIHYFVKGEPKNSIKHLKMFQVLNKEFENKNGLDNNKSKLGKNWIDYIEALIKKLPRYSCSDKEKIYHIGDADCLALSYHNIKFEKRTFCILPLLIFNATAYDLSVPDNNQTKAFIKRNLDAIPTKSLVFISIGEIDCLSNEGFLNASKRHEVELDSLIEKTLKNYIEWLVAANTINCHRFKFLNLPAPTYASKYSYSANQERVKVISIFNEKLKKNLKDNSFDLIDIYSCTKKENGFSNNRYQLDESHFDCRILEVIENQIN